MAFIRVSIRGRVAHFDDDGSDTRMIWVQTAYPKREEGVMRVSVELVLRPRANITLDRHDVVTDSDINLLREVFPSIMLEASDETAPSTRFFRLGDSDYIKMLLALEREP